MDIDDLYNSVNPIEVLCIPILNSSNFRKSQTSWRMPYSSKTIDQKKKFPLPKKCRGILYLIIHIIPYAFTQKLYIRRVYLFFLLQPSRLGTSILGYLKKIIHINIDLKHQIARDDRNDHIGVKVAMISCYNVCFLQCSI